MSDRHNNYNDVDPLNQINANIEENTEENINEITNVHDRAITSDNLSEESSNNEESSNVSKLGCPHYHRGCKLLFPCCNELFGCRFCHDEEKDSYRLKTKNQHVADRTAIQHVQCLTCKKTQDISKKCRFCTNVFGNYFCNICKLLDLDDKGQFHCTDCGICRQGGENNFVHCETCGICNATNHKCKRKVDGDCPICCLSLFNHISQSMMMKCGHWIHSTCFAEYIKYNYKCPICSKGLTETNQLDDFIAHRIASTPMPDEYMNKEVNILCNECNAKSITMWHFYGHKCIDCLSYNTKII